MICPKCGSEMKKGLKFCSECGASLVVQKRKCIKCGAEINADMKFCPECGANQAQPVCPKCGYKAAGGTEILPGMRNKPFVKALSSRSFRWLTLNSAE